MQDVDAIVNEALAVFSAIEDGKLRVDVAARYTLDDVDQAHARLESRQQIGWVIIGGMTIGTFFTLFVVPVVYTLLARQHKAKEE